MKSHSTSFGTKPTLKTPVKKCDFSAYISPLGRSGFLQYHGKNAGSAALSFCKKCQENLTKFRHWVENIDNTSPLQKMGKIEKGAAVGAGMLGILAMDPALAQAAEKQDTEKSTEFQVAALSVKQDTGSKLRNCMQEAKALPGTKKEKIKHLRQCKREQADQRIAEQEKTLASKKETLAEKKRILREQQAILAKLDEAVRQLKMRVNKNGQILNEQGRVIAQIVAINGRLILKREQLDMQIAEIRKDRAKIQADTQRMLDEAERILNQLVS